MKSLSKTEMKSIVGGELSGGGGGGGEFRSPLYFANQQMDLHRSAQGLGDLDPGGPNFSDGIPDTGGGGGRGGHVKDPEQR